MTHRILSPLLVAAVVALAAGCSRQQAPAPTPPPTKVTASPPRLETVTNWDEYPGHIEAVETVEVRPRVPGYIESVHFQDGAEVKAGDLLFVIDPQPFQAEVDHAQAQRLEVESRLELARNDLQRAEGLRGTKAISEEEYDRRSKAVLVEQGALAAAKATEARARLDLAYTQVKAPISGKIGRRLITPGNFVQLQGNNGAATLLATIVSLDPIYCYFDVEESAFVKYRRNAQATVGTEAKAESVPCEVGLVNEEGFAHQGRLDFFDNQVNPKTGTIRLRAVFANADRALVPGMFANARVMAGAPEPALLVPDAAIQSDQGYKYLYVVGAESKVERRDIVPGRAHGPLRAVLKGLAPDEKVIVNGLMMLRPGTKVDVQVATNQSAAAKQASDAPKAEK